MTLPTCFSNNLLCNFHHVFGDFIEHNNIQMKIVYPNSSIVLEGIRSYQFLATWYSYLWHNNQCIPYNDAFYILFELTFCNHWSGESHSQSVYQKSCILEWLMFCVLCFAFALCNTSCPQVFTRDFRRQQSLRKIWELSTSIIFAFHTF